MIKSRLDLAIRARCDVAHLICAAKFIDCPQDYLSSLLWGTGLVFVVDRKLLVGLIAVP
jgi:hypothetical protein